MRTTTALYLFVVTAILLFALPVHASVVSIPAPLIEDDPDEQVYAWDEQRAGTAKMSEEEQGPDAPFNERMDASGGYTLNDTTVVEIVSEGITKGNKSKTADEYTLSDTSEVDIVVAGQSKDVDEPSHEPTEDDDQEIDSVTLVSGYDSEEKKQDDGEPDAQSASADVQEHRESEREVSFIVKLFRFIFQ